MRYVYLALSSATFGCALGATNIVAVRLFALAGAVFAITAAISKR